MMLKPFIISGQGVAFFTPIGFLAEIKAGDVVPIPLSGSRLQNLHIGILVQRRRQRTHAAEAVIEFVGAELLRFSDQIMEAINP